MLGHQFYLGHPQLNMLVGRIIVYFICVNFNKSNKVINMSGEHGNVHFFDKSKQRCFILKKNNKIYNQKK